MLKFLRVHLSIYHCEKGSISLEEVVRSATLTRARGKTHMKKVWKRRKIIEWLPLAVGDGSPLAFRFPNSEVFGGLDFGSLTEVRTALGPPGSAGLLVSRM